MRASLCAVLCWSLLVVGMASCRTDAPPEEAAPTDSTAARIPALAALDSAALNTAALDSAAQAVAVDPTQTTLDSLQHEVRRLRDVLTALQRSNRQFLDDLGDGRLGPIGGPASRERSREFGWQVRQGIGLLGEVRAALHASHQQFMAAFIEAAPDDSTRSLGYQLRLEIARLGDVSTTLDQARTRLRQVQRADVGEESPVDSLRKIGNQVDVALERQGRVLDALRRYDPLLDSLSALQVTGPLPQAAQQIRQEVGLLSAVQTSLDASNEAFLGTLAGDLQQYGGKLFLALLVIAISFYVIRGLGWFLESLAERSAARRLFFKKLIPIARLTIWGLTIYFVLANIFELDQGGLLAAATALGVAIGFAAQDVLKNIFGGILIIFDQPFQVGDKINVGGTYGEVVAIGLRSTRIVTPDDNLVSVPNSQVIDSQVANANAGALDCQVVVDLFLPGWVDVVKAKAIAYSAAANSKYVYLQKPIVVNVKDTFKETFLTQLKVKAYVLDTRYEFAFASDVTETAKAEFMRHGFFKGMGGKVPAPLEQPANGASSAPSPRDAS